MIILSPIFNSKYKKEKHYKKFLVQISETGVGIKYNSSHVKKLNKKTHTFLKK